MPFMEKNGYLHPESLSIQAIINQRWETLAIAQGNFYHTRHHKISSLRLYEHPRVN